MIGIDAQYETGPSYVLHQFLLDNGTQLGRLHTYLKDRLLPAFEKRGTGAQIVLEAIVAAHQPQVIHLQEFEDLKAWREATAALRSDPDLLEANTVWDREGPYQSYTVSLFSGTNYSPRLATEAGGIFELRTYCAAGERTMNGVHERFAGPEVPIFHRCGIHPILFLSAIAGPQLPNMTYLTPFESLAAREAAWAKFQADPEWHAVRQASVDKYGFTPRVITTSLFKAAPYSPIR